MADLTPPKTPKRRIRRPTLARVLREADRAGRKVSAVTYEGVTLHFGEPKTALPPPEPPEPTNPWDAIYAMQ